MTTDSDHHGRSTEGRARQRRSIITIGLVLLMLFFAAWYAMSYIRANDTATGATTTLTPSPTSSCDLTPEEVPVNVYNATNRAGLAAQVASDLRKRGFQVLTVANDPKREELTGRGELRYGELGKPGAELVSQHIGSFAKQVDERTRTSVDVVLGPKFDRLVDTARVAPTC